MTANFGSREGMLVLYHLKCFKYFAFMADSDQILPETSFRPCRIRCPGFPDRYLMDRVSNNMPDMSSNFTSSCPVSGTHLSLDIG